jgi:hypothetical protein
MLSTMGLSNLAKLGISSSKVTFGGICNLPVSISRAIILPILTPSL